VKLVYEWWDGEVAMVRAVMVIAAGLSGAFQVGVASEPMRVPLERLLEQKLADGKWSLNRCLRDIAVAAKARYLGKRWTDVSRELAAEGLVAQDSWTKDVVVNHHYRIRRAVRSDGAVPFDLELKIAVGKEDKSLTYHGVVVSVDVVARFAVDRTLTKALRSNIAPAGSALEKVLKSKQVDVLAKRFPYVNRIDVSYEMSGDMWKPVKPYGFDVSIEMSSGSGAGNTHKLKTFFVESRLDAPGKEEGHEGIGSGDDSLGEVR
jgi:hypothetical protein